MHGEHSTTGWAGHERSSPEYRRIMIALFAAGVAAFAQLYSPQGILPLVARDLDLSAALSAALVSSATLGLACSVLAWSGIADRIGRAQTLRLALLGACVFGVLACIAPTFELIVAARFLEGAALGGVPAVAMVYLGEEVSARASAVAAGTFVAGNSIGGLAGRVIAAPIAEWWGWRAGMAAVLLVAIICVVAFIAILPPARGFVRRSERTPLLRAVLGHLGTPVLWPLFAVSFLLMGGFVSVYNYLAFRLEAPPYLLPVTITALLFLAYLSGTASSRLVGRLVARTGRWAALATSTAIYVVGALLTASSPLPVIVIGLLLFTAGFFAAHAVASEWVPRAARGYRAQASALYTFGYYAGSSAIGMVSGLIFDAWGWGAVVVSVAAGGVAVLALGLLLGLPRASRIADRRDQA